MPYLLSAHLHRRHLFGNAGIELRELYLSMSLQTFAMSLIGIFVPIYLYQVGFNLTQILVFFMLYFAGRMGFDFIAAELVAKYGPKHVMSLSYIFAAIDLLILLSLESWPYFSILVAATLIMAFKNSLYFISYHVDFSRVEDPVASGRSLSTMSIAISIASAIGPLAGGLLANFFGFRLVIVVAIALIAFAMKPLFKTGEAVRQYKLEWRRLPVKVLRPGLRWGLTGVDHFIMVDLWPLFIFLVVFRDNPYLGVGAALTLALLFTILTDHWIGKWIDQGKTILLRQFSAGIAMVVHIWRLGVSSVLPVVMVNVISDAANSGLVLSESSRLYEAAGQSGSRIEYIAITESISNALKASYCLALVLISLSNPDGVLRAGFIIGAVLISPLLFRRRS